MNVSNVLRVAAIITLVYCAGHTSGMPWTPATGPEQAATLDAMRTHTFVAFGAARTYWDFYFGFGVIISAFLLAQAVALWQLGGIARTSPRQVRGMIATFFVASLANAILGWQYFFAVPALMAAAIVVCLAVAFVLAGRARG